MIIRITDWQIENSIHKFLMCHKYDNIRNLTYIVTTLKKNTYIITLENICN